MLRTGLALVALSLGTASVASAQAALDPVLSTLTRQGFGGFEISRENGQLKVEARKGTTERELVYDAASGQLLKDEVGRSDDRSVATPASPRLRGVYDSLRAKGYTNFDVEQVGNRIEVDVEDGAVERDLVFDARTGALVSERIDDDRNDRRDDDRSDRDDDDRDDNRGSGRSGGRGGNDDDDDDDDRGGASRGGDSRSGSDRDDDDRSGSSGRGGRGGGDDDRDDDRDDD